MKRWISVVVVLWSAVALGAQASPALVAPLSPAAKKGPPPPADLLGGQMVGASRNLLFIQAGYPGLSAAFLRGLSPTMDLGVRADFDYQLEDMTDVSDPELKIQLVYRLALLRGPRLTLALEVDPGFAAYFGNTTRMGPTLPVRLQAGLPLGRQWRLHFGLDTGLTVFFKGYRSWHVPVLAGGGLQWVASRRIALDVDVKAGPVISHYGYPVIGETDTSFGLEASLGLSWSL